MRGVSSRDGSLGLRGIIARRQEESNVRLVVIRTDTTKEGDTVLWDAVPEPNTSVNSSSHECGENKPWESPSSSSATRAHTVFRHQVG
jgi:hypothetical protein